MYQDISNTFGPKVFEGLQRFFLQIDITENIIHEAGEPDGIVEFLIADRLAAKQVLRFFFVTKTKVSTGT